MKYFTNKTLHAVRVHLGFSCKQMADWLFMSAKWADRTVRRWEEGDLPIPGPVRKCLLLAELIDKEGSFLDKKMK